MKVNLCGLLLFLFFSIPPAYAENGAKIGNIQTLKGSSTILRGGQSLAAAPGVLVYRDDLIQTAKDSAVGVVLVDDSTISLGAESEVLIEICDFVPKEGKFALVLRMMKGTFSYISGMISKLAPESVRLEIPDATIAVRGTKLLVDVRE